MNKFSGIALLTLAIVTVCVFPNAEAKDSRAKSVIPTRLRLDIGGFLGNMYSVELIDSGTLLYTLITPDRKDQKEGRFTPTPKQWQKFREDLDDIKVWKWSDDYTNMRVNDGTQWSLDIAYGDKQIKAKGSNSYPDKSGKSNNQPEFTKSFKTYVKAVVKLIDGNKFE